MINGEGIRDINSELASPDPFNSFPSLRVLKFDGGDTSPVSSRYSSCGESDFDRYCSANSVMGTPSMCSTITSFNDCTESEFGSLKNFGIGDDNGLENFSLGGRLERNYKDQGLSSSGGPDRLSDGTTGSCKENIDKQPSIKYGSSGLELYGNDNELFTMSYQGVHGAGDEIGLVRVEGESGLGVGRLSKDRDKDVFSGDDEEGSTVCTGYGQLRGVGGDCVEKGTTNEIGNAGSTGSTESYFSGNKDEKSSQFLGMVGEGCSSSTVHGEEDSDGLDTQSNLKFGGRETEREEDDNSSKYQYSEGEDSMYNYGTDDDNKNELCFPRNLHYHQESKGENGNPLLMNSSVVFGSEDWDDFMLETEGSYGISHTFDGFLKQKEKNPEVKESIINFASTSSKDFSSDGSHEQARDTKCMAIGSNKVEDIYEAEKMDSCSEVPFGSQALGEPEEVKDGGDIHGTCCQVQGTEFTKKSSNSSTGFQIIIEPQQENVREIHDAINQVQGAENLVTCSIYNADLDPWADTAPLATGLSIMDYSIKEKGHQCKNTEDAVSITHTQHIENADLAISKVKSDILSDITVAKVSSSVEPPGNIETQFFEDHKSDALPSNFEMRKSVKSSLSSTDFFEEASATSKMENFELNEFYDELVHEMEEILLDSVDSPGARFPQGNRMLLSHLALPSRDGGSKASTSGTDDTYPLVQHSVRVDEIEVVGARQKKGDVSFSERLVGVKEYTVYKIKVSSGKVQWEVERRYRDFLTLYRRMKTLFTEQGWDLPAPWTLVEKETRKIFGSASPDVIEERSVLIQECLRSILHSRFFSSPPSALIWFLSPQDSFHSSPLSDTPVSESAVSMRGENANNFSTLGKTISLIVEIQPQKSMRQILEAQHYTCAGCHKHFDDGRTLISDFVQTFGWGKPRRCEYTNQLFCSSCHTNETAVLPARVLHHWDFFQYPVSQMAKSYLDSIHDQPMLCVSAVNPFLFSKVPALLHVMGIRKRIGSMLPYVRCPFRRSINRGLGSRRYLLESNDFFSLRDLIDLSKGAFAALPVMVETVSRKILEHITEQCLICCDVGLPCGARQDCNDPSSLIFPFQEGEVERCTSCGSVFHNRCFKKLAICPCGAQIGVDETMGLTKTVSRRAGEVRGTLDLFGGRLSSGLSGGFLSGLFSKEKPERTAEHKDNTILMGSLPSTSL